MEIKQENINDDTVLVSVSGRLDLYKVEQFRIPIDELLKINVSLIINFKDLVYIDSSGIGVLLNIYHLMMKKKKALCFINIVGEVKKVIKLISIDKIIPIKESLEEAITFIKL